MKRKYLLLALISIVVVAAAIGAVVLYKKHKDAQLTQQVLVGSESFASGNFEAARSQYEQGKIYAQSQEEKGTLEILVAATYDASDPAHAAELYRAVMNNTQYPASVRSYAASYLLLMLNNQYLPQVAEQVFTSAPWVGYWDTSVSLNVRYQQALAQGHEWALSVSPNYLSYLLAGEYYARVYTTFNAQKQQEVLPKIYSYYTQGSEELARLAPTLQQNVGAMSYRTLAIYATSYNRLLTQKKIPSSNPVVMNDGVVKSAYAMAEAYMHELPDSTFKDLSLFGTFVHHADFLLSVQPSAEDKQQLTEIGNSIAKLINSDTALAQNVEFNTSSKAPYPIFRRVLSALGKTYSSALKESLLAHTNTFTGTDFK